MAKSFGRTALVALLLGAPNLAHAAKEDEAASRVMAATLIAERCKGIAGIGNGDNQSFVIAASDLLKSQGYRGNRMRTLLFYADSASLAGMGRHALAARGVDLDNTAALCRFGQGVAGQQDAIGQFLVKGRD